MLYSSRAGHIAKPPVDLRRLASRLAKGDDAAFEDFYMQLASGLHAFFVRLGWSPAEAEDGVQDVFLRVWKKRKELSRYRHPAGFVYRLARNAWVDNGRAKVVEERWRSAKALSDSPATSETDPALRLEHEEHVELVRRAIDRLPKRLRLVLLMKKVSGLKGAEIAAALDIPPGTVASRLHHAIIQVRASVYGQEVPRESHGDL